MRQYLDRIPSWLKNKYVLTTLCFAVWILFIDDRDFITTHFRHVRELHKLEARKLYFEDQILTVRKELDQLKSNPATLGEICPGKISDEAGQRRYIYCKIEGKTRLTQKVIRKDSILALYLYPPPDDHP